MDRNTLWEVLNLDRWLVALRKESVDRNSINSMILMQRFWSLSARRAWIEIYKYSIPYIYILGRSPQGERG